MPEPPDGPTDVVWPIHSVSGPGGEKRVHWLTGAQAKSFVERMPVPPGWRYTTCTHLRDVEDTQ